MRRCLRAEAGSATLEMVVWGPVLLLIASIIVLAGRTAQASQTVEVAAAEAARAASAANSEPQARARASAAVAAALGSAGLRCTTTSVTLDTSQWARTAGSPARVAATVRCHVALGDLAIPGIPGTRTITGQGSSRLDTYRTRP